MNCRQALRTMDRVLDCTATEEEARILHFHVSGCTSCRRAFEMNRDISRVVKELSRPEPPSDLEARVRTRIASMPAAAPRRSRLVIALPFVAALLVAIGLSMGRGAGSVQDTMEAVVEKAEEAGGAWKHSVTTPRLTAYVRPASLVSF